MHLDFKLTLGRNLIEAAATRLTLNSNDAKAIACILADTLESGKSIVVDERFESLSLGADSLLFLASLIHDLIKFLFLLFEDMLIV